MTRRILTGNQAVAIGALRAGVGIATGYPGTPSTGCLAHLLKLELPGRYVEWSSNEKVAFEIASGAAWAGRRALCTMKMSGVNVAYDALISIAYSGTNGGLVLYVADDPGVSAGMPEQDTRGFALMSDLPMLEPASPAEAYDLTQKAFELSEKTGAPVFLRLTTAVALAHSVIEVDESVAPKPAPVVLDKDITRYTKAGSKICLDQHRALIERLEAAGKLIHEMDLHRLELSEKRGGLGIIACGAVNAYVNEALASVQSKEADQSSALMLKNVSLLRAVTTVPFPQQEVRALLAHCERVVVLEELEPHMERGVAVAARQMGFDGPIIGKLNGTLSRIGEYRLSEVLRGLEAALGTSHTREQPKTVLARDAEGVAPQTRESQHAILASTDGDAEGRSAGIHPAPRPITVCAGCPHRGTYLAIEAAIKQAGFEKEEVMVTGDIGCTILGMNPPFDLLWTEVSMGSSVSLAQGYVHAGIETPVIATIGDSTFFHGGIPGLINAIQHNTPLTLLIMDNGWTAMTGMQVNAGTNDAFQAPGGRRLDLVRVVEGLGPDSIAVVDPYDVEAVTAAITASLTTSGVHVVIAQRECAIQARRRGVVEGVMTVDPEKCILCKQCLRVTGCPALSVSATPKERGESSEDDSPGGFAIGAEPTEREKSSKDDSPGKGSIAGESKGQGESLKSDSPGGLSIAAEPTEREESSKDDASPASSIQIDETLCNGCGICATVCPTSALKVERRTS